jgi:hypothetical protein
MDCGFYQTFIRWTHRIVRDDQEKRDPIERGSGMKPKKRATRNKRYCNADGGDDRGSLPRAMRRTSRRLGGAASAAD